MAEFDHPIRPQRPNSYRVWEAREKAERGTPKGLIRNPLQEPEMRNVKGDLLPVPEEP